LLVAKGNDRIDGEEVKSKQELAGCAAVQKREADGVHRTCDKKKSELFTIPTTSKGVKFILPKMFKRIMYFNKDLGNVNICPILRSHTNF